MALGDPIDRIVGNVVEKDRPVGKSTEQIKAIVAAFDGRIASIGSLDLTCEASLARIMLASFRKRCSIVSYLDFQRHFLDSPAFVKHVFWNATLAEANGPRRGIIWITTLLGGDIAAHFAFK